MNASQSILPRRHVIVFIYMDMPLTLSHAAAAVPLRRFRLPATALIMGCMAPDFEFFLRVNHNRVIAHTIPGLFIFCLPIGLAGLYLFHKFLKFPLLSLLPGSHQIRLHRAATRFTFWPARRFGLILLSLLIGAASHLLWDAFTHHNGWFVAMIPALRYPLIKIAGQWLMVYDLLQHGSTIFGLAVLGLAYKRWYLRAPLIRTHVPYALSRAARISIGMGLGVFSCAGGIVYGIVAAPAGHFRPYLPLTFVAVVSAFLAAWAVFSAVWHIAGPSET